MAKRSAVSIVQVLLALAALVVLVVFSWPASTASRSAKSKETKLEDRAVSSESRGTAVFPESKLLGGSIPSSPGKSISFISDASINPELAHDLGIAAKSVDKSVAAAESSKGTDAATSPPKIIYEADITLAVESFPKAEQSFRDLLKKAGGYIADSTIDRTQGQQMSGRWRVRVPVDQYETFIEAVSNLGVAESQHQTAQDVTAEFVDLNAQIANKKQLEQRIVELLKNSQGQIADVITVERELARVRGEIEQMEGRLRYLTNRTDYTTVAVTAREQHEYVPPESPTFMGQIAGSWQDSTTSLSEFGKHTVLTIVGAVPWICLACVAVVPFWWWWKRVVVRRAARRGLTSVPEG
jgi:uncharacterized coiled-coil protein SlyX